MSSHTLSPLLFLPSIFLSIRVFSNESALRIRWPKYWSFSTSPPSEYSGLISFRIDWFDLLAVQGTHKGLFQHRNSKASVLQHSTFFMFLLLYPYMIIGKTIALVCITAPKCAVELGARLTLALAMWTFVGKVMSLFFFLTDYLGSS